MTEGPVPTPPRDPASLNTQLTISGLDRYEASAVFHAIPAGRSVAFTVTRPVMGGLRYAATSDDLSTVQARDVLAALVEHAEAVWNGASPRELVSDPRRNDDTPTPSRPPIKGGEYDAEAGERA